MCDTVLHVVQVLASDQKPAFLNFFICKVFMKCQICFFISDFIATLQAQKLFKTKLIQNLLLLKIRCFLE